MALSLLVEEARVHRENHRPADKLYHIYRVADKLYHIYRVADKLYHIYRVADKLYHIYRVADKLYHIYRVFLILFLTFGGLLLLLYSHFMTRPRNTRIWLEITMGFECVHSGCYEPAVMPFIF